MSNVNIVLSDLSFSVQMLQTATMDIKEPPSLYDVSAAAVFTVSTTDMRNVFQFRTDSVDMTNTDATDLKYYVDMGAWHWIIMHQIFLLVLLPILIII